MRYPNNSEPQMIMSRFTTNENVPNGIIISPQRKRGDKYEKGGAHYERAKELRHYQKRFRSRRQQEARDKRGRFMRLVSGMARC
jgi:hypothetical protein